MFIAYLGKMKILLIEPFFTGSHQQWAEGFQKHSSHDVQLLTLSGQFWKWRMHGGAITLANQFLAKKQQIDLILASDMLDLNLFLSLTRKQTANIPTAIYFHENQLAYPWSPADADVSLKRDQHYMFINYASALTADVLFFNSQYHLDAFSNSLPEFLKKFPDHKNLESIETIRNKCKVLYLGMDLQAIRDLNPQIVEPPKRAVIGWNHRWEYDKNPEGFFQTLFALDDRGIDFKLVVLGEQFKSSPKIFNEAKERLADKMLHWGYAESYAEYIHWLYQIDVLPVTAKQDFFGGSVVEAMACDCVPLLPKRLAYPEHLPEAFHPTYFYENETDLLKRLQGICFHVGLLRKQNIHRYVMRYDWQNIIREYDSAFEDVLNG